MKTSDQVDELINMLTIFYVNVPENHAFGKEIENFLSTLIASMEHIKTSAIKDELRIQILTGL